uniref:Helicase ATP-binding domain-containing protein n=1 Tax=Strongyloides stercoralis TaxID=6248 RepID=A0AAF5DML8_STRER
FNMDFNNINIYKKYIFDWTKTNTYVEDAVDQYVNDLSDLNKKNFNNIKKVLEMCCNYKEFKNSLQAIGCCIIGRENKNITVNSPTGCGKTLMVLSNIICKLNYITCIILPTITLIQQYENILSSINVGFITITSYSDKKNIKNFLKNDLNNDKNLLEKYNVILITPESFLKEKIINMLNNLYKNKILHRIVLDEVYQVIDYDLRFRKDYLNILYKLNLFSDIQVIMMFFIKKNISIITLNDDEMEEPSIIFNCVKKLIILLQIFIKIVEKIRWNTGCTRCVHNTTSILITTSINLIGIDTSFFTILFQLCIPISKSEMEEEYKLLMLKLKESTCITELTKNNLSNEEKRIISIYKIIFNEEKEDINKKKEIRTKKYSDIDDILFKRLKKSKNNGSNENNENNNDNGNLTISNNIINNNNLNNNVNISGNDNNINDIIERNKEVNKENQSNDSNNMDAIYEEKINILLNTKEYFELYMSIMFKLIFKFNSETILLNSNNFDMNDKLLLLMLSLYLESRKLLKYDLQ